MASFRWVTLPYTSPYPNLLETPEGPLGSPVSVPPRECDRRTVMYCTGQLVNGVLYHEPRTVGVSTYDSDLLLTDLPSGLKSPDVNLRAPPVRGT